jgi:hypothetical protein
MYVNSKPAFITLFYLSQSSLEIGIVPVNRGVVALEMDQFMSNKVTTQTRHKKKDKGEQ